MRDQFYADRRDLWKWTVALHEAADRRIVYVAMYRPDQERDAPLGIRDDVRNFFHAESKTLHRERKCSRISKLSERILPFLDIYDPRQATQYSSWVCQLLNSRAPNEKYLILVDPDTGMAEGSAKPEHVCPEHLGQVWGSMQTGDTLLVYQHHVREELQPWIARKQLCLANAVGRTVSDVFYQSQSDVCFFQVTK